MAGQRSPQARGLIGLGVVLAATLAAMQLDSVPIIGAGSVYRAEFDEAAGLRSSDEVRIAGVKVGKVLGVELDGDHVDVTFRVNDAWVGDDSTAAIEIKTIVGTKYLALTPRGDAVLSSRDAIPRERTTSPYDVLEAFSDGAALIGDIDTTQLADSMTTLSEAFADTPSDVRASLDGITRLSRTIADRDQQLRDLFDATAATSSVLADRSEQLSRLIADAGPLLEELNFRQQSIGLLLVATRDLAAQLTGLVRDNDATIGPLLDNLVAVLDVLNRENANLSRAMELYGPYTRYFTNVLGNGRFIDGLITNLLPPGLPVLPGYRPPAADVGPN